jgi:tetratricopeptide (TPR) repeat protein
LQSLGWVNPTCIACTAAGTVFPAGLQALQYKAQGNEFYKARNFDAAIEMYNKALECYDKDVSFLTNR